jgi:hypothetical protein
MKTNFKSLAKKSKLAIFAVAILPALFTTNCSKDELENIEPTASADVELKATYSCNFSDLLVETSWISGDKDDRDSFDAADVDGESWMDVYSDGRVMMKCLAPDGHRTELKEDDGDEAALNEYKKMYFTAKYTNIPENGVTIAQIHNRGGVNRPFVRLYIDADRYIKIKETETDPTASSSTYTTYTGPKYTSGDAVTIYVWTGLSGEKKGKFTVVTTSTTWSQTVWPSSAWSSFSSDYYLKAGVYTEGDDLTATVKYNSFSISH